MPHVVGIDLGGTKVFGALVDPAVPGPAGAGATTKRSTPTDRGIDGVLDAVAEAVAELDPTPAAIGIGAPGVIEPGTGRVLVAPNLDGFDRPVPLGERLAERFGCPVAVTNDVNAAALGEARAGAAQGHDDVLAVWLGTGLGAGLVLDGRLRSGPHGLAGELGHVTVVPGGRRCGCGGVGHLEAYVGRLGLEAAARDRQAAGEATALLDAAGDDRLKSKAFRKAYDAGDPVTVELVDEGIHLLGLAVANVSIAVDVSAVVVGGGLGERFADEVVERLTARLAELAFAGARPVVLEAALGDLAGPVGAASLAAELLERTS